MRHEWVFDDSTTIGFVTGRFDNFAVLFEYEGKRVAATEIGCSLWARDSEYFTTFLKYFNTYGDILYHDFCVIYHRTCSVISETTLMIIRLLSRKYGDEALAINKLLALLYYTMTAEENKNNSPLGKRIKMLGIHQILFSEMEPMAAASFSKGKKWRELDAIMVERGF